MLEELEMKQRNAPSMSRREFGSFFAMAVCSCKSMKTPSNRFASLQSDLRSILLEARSFQGVVLVNQGSNKVYSAALGHADNKAQRRIKLNDRFVIGSISKQLTAALVLRAYETQQLSLKDPVGNHIPKIKAPWSQQVTIHHLLTHTHGIQDIDKPLRFEAGRSFEYSQLGYALLSQVLEGLHGHPFAQQCRALFSELGLSATYHPQDQTRAKQLFGFERGEHGKYRRAADSLKNYAAAGSMISTASDLARWNELLFSGRVVSPASLHLMSTRYATRQHPIFNEVEYGYGLLFKRGEQDLQIGALGYAPGFTSASYYYPKTNMSLVVLSNRVDLSQGFKHAFQVHTDLMQRLKNQ